jgi:hypothetical protein
MASPVGQPLIVKIPVNNDMVQRAFSLLKNRRVSRSEEHFLISTETIDHSDMGEYIPLLLEQYKDADEEVKAYIKRLKLNHEGQQFAKAIVVGTKNRLSVSIIATSRTKIDGIDRHKILIATTKKIVEMSASWNFFAKIFGIKSSEQKELESIVSKLNDEDSKKCLEAMAIYVLGDKIRTFIGTDVDVQFIEQ